MSQKHKKQEVVSDHSSDEDFQNDEDELDIEEEVINKIKNLPTLKEKIHCIAINHYIEQKRAIDAKLQREIEQIGQKYRVKFNPFIQQINQIISGEFEFKETDFEGTEEILTGEELAGKEPYTKKEKIPQYWLKVFLNSEIIAEQVQQIDEPLLKHLEKIEAEKTEDLKRFSVYFYFSENQWFTNTKVSKHFDIEETEIKKSHGDQINWKEGKNITVKTVKKKGKKGGKKTKQVKQPSFFNLFKQIELTSDDEEQNVDESQNQEDEVEELELQYEIFENIYEDVIPKSLEYYLNLVGGCGECEDENCHDDACGKQAGKHDHKVVDEEDDE